MASHIGGSITVERRVNHPGRREAVRAGARRGTPRQARVATPQNQPMGLARAIHPLLLLLLLFSSLSYILLYTLYSALFCFASLPFVQHCPWSQKLLRVHSRIYLSEDAKDGPFPHHQRCAQLSSFVFLQFLLIWLLFLSFFLLYEYFYRVRHNDKDAFCLIHYYFSLRIGRFTVS